MSNALKGKRLFSCYLDSCTIKKPPVSQIETGGFFIPFTTVLF